MPEDRYSDEQLDRIAEAGGWTEPEPQLGHDEVASVVREVAAESGMDPFTRQGRKTSAALTFELHRQIDERDSPDLGAIAKRDARTEELIDAFNSGEPLKPRDRRDLLVALAKGAEGDPDGIVIDNE